MAFTVPGSAPAATGGSYGSRTRLEKGLGIRPPFLLRPELARPTLKYSVPCSTGNWNRTSCEEPVWTSLRLTGGDHPINRIEVFWQPPLDLVDTGTLACDSRDPEDKAANQKTCQEEERRHSSRWITELSTRDYANAQLGVHRQSLTNRRKTAGGTTPRVGVVNFTSTYRPYPASRRTLRVFDRTQAKKGLPGSYQPNKKLGPGS